MEGKELTRDMLENKEGKSFEELGFHILEHVPFMETVNAGLELAEKTTVIGDDGFVYRSPMRTAVASYIKLNYFTDADVSAYETAEDMGALYDFYQTAFNTMDEPAFTKAGYDTAIRIAREAFDVMKERSSPIAKLSFVVEKIFEYLMNPEEVAHAPEINERLIDALHILREEEKKEDTANKLTMFAKK